MPVRLLSNNRHQAPLPFFLPRVKHLPQLFALWPFWCSPLWWYFTWRRSETHEWMNMIGLAKGKPSSVQSKQQCQSSANCLKNNTRAALLLSSNRVLSNLSGPAPPSLPHTAVRLILEWLPTVFFASCGTEKGEEGEGGREGALLCPPLLIFSYQDLLSWDLCSSSPGIKVSQSILFPFFLVNTASKPIFINTDSFSQVLSYFFLSSFFSF